MKGRYITIELQDGRRLVAKVLYGSGDNFTVQGADGNLYEIDRHTRTFANAYVVLG
jgi:hypothetical protein